MGSLRTGGHCRYLYEDIDLYHIRSHHPGLCYTAAILRFQPYSSWAHRRIDVAGLRQLDVIFVVSPVSLCALESATKRSSRIRRRGSALRFKTAGARSCLHRGRPQHLEGRQSGARKCSALCERSIHLWAWKSRPPPLSSSPSWLPSSIPPLTSSHRPTSTSADIPSRPSRSRSRYAGSCHAPSRLWRRRRVSCSVHHISSTIPFPHHS